MSMLKRLKKDGADGFKKMVKTIETIDPTKQRDVVTAGILEDANYMMWVQKNLIDIGDVLGLSSEEFQTLVDQTPNFPLILNIAFRNHQLEEKMLSLIDLKQRKKYEEEKEYTLSVTVSQQRSAQITLLERVRHLQDQGLINSIFWKFPSTDVLYGKCALPSDGVWSQKFENGSPSAVGPLALYERHGNWVHFFPDGSIMAKGGYLRGQKSGKWEFYSPAGELVAQGLYESDHKKGEWLIWDDDGKLIKQKVA